MFNKSLYIPFFKTDDDYPKKKTTKNTRDDSKAKVGIVYKNGGDARFIIPVRLRTLKLYVGECENTEVVIVCVFCSWWQGDSDLIIDYVSGHGPAVFFSEEKLKTLLKSKDVVAGTAQYIVNGTAIVTLIML